MKQVCNLLPSHSATQTFKKTEVVRIERTRSFLRDVSNILHYHSAKLPYQKNKLPRFDSNEDRTASKAGVLPIRRHGNGGRSRTRTCKGLPPIVFKTIDLPLAYSTVDRLLPAPVITTFARHVTPLIVFAFGFSAKTTASPLLTCTHKQSIQKKRAN